MSTRTQSDSPSSNYGRKKAFLASYNRRPLADDDKRTEPKTGRVWGFDFGPGEKPWQQKR